jgi:hypothetical protein
MRINRRRPTINENLYTNPSLYSYHPTDRTTIHITYAWFPRAPFKWQPLGWSRSSLRALDNARANRRPEGGGSVHGNGIGSSVAADTPSRLCRAGEPTGGSGGRLRRGERSQRLAGRRCGSTVASSVDVVTLVKDLFAIHSPHFEVLESDVRERDLVRAGNTDSATLRTVVHCSGPVLEGEARELDGTRVGGRVAVPVLVDVERVGGVVGPKVLEDGVLHVASCSIAAGPGLNHQHLSALIDVDVAHGNVRNSGGGVGSHICWGLVTAGFYQRIIGASFLTIGGQRSNRHATTLVAIDFLDEDVCRRGLNADALISVCDLDMVQITVVSATEINTIRSTFVWSTNGNMVRFQVRDAAKDEMEGRRINQDDVVDRNVFAAEEP